MCITCNKKDKVGKQTLRGREGIKANQEEILHIDLRRQEVKIEEAIQKRRGKGQGPRIESDPVWEGMEEKMGMARAWPNPSSSRGMAVTERDQEQVRALYLRTKRNSAISMVKGKTNRKFYQFTMSSLQEKWSTLLSLSLIKFQNYSNVERLKRNAILTIRC